MKFLKKTIYKKKGFLSKVLSFFNQRKCCHSQKRKIICVINHLKQKKKKHPPDSSIEFLLMIAQSTLKPHTQNKKRRKDNK